MAKDMFQGKQGVWRTLPNGVHIFIPDGSDLETEMSKFDEPSWEIEYNKSRYADNFTNKITYADFKYHYRRDDEILKPGKYAKEVLHKCFERRKYSDPEMDKLILGGLNNCVRELVVNDRHTNWFKAGIERRLQISIDTRPCMLEAISHEIGHAIDYEIFRGFRSSTYLSSKYGKTMREMLLEEFPKHKEILMGIDGEITKAKHENKDLDQATFLSEAETDLVDMAQAVLGDKTCKEIFGYLGHEPKYFEKDKANSGTECFAELTSSLFCDKDKTFYNIIKRWCPKTIDIYHEIIEEVKSEWTK